MKGKRWSDERSAALEKFRRLGMSGEEALLCLSTMAGPPLTLAAVRQKTHSMGLSGWEKRDAVQASLRQALPVPAEVKAVAPAPAPKKQPPFPNAGWSQERHSLLRQMLEQALPWDVILTEINALPGLPVTEKAARSRASSYGMKPSVAPVRRPPDSLPEPRSRDGFVSGAHIAVLRDLSVSTDVPIPREDLTRWVRYHVHSSLVPNPPRAGAVLAVANAQRASQGLPPFKLVARTARHDPLPSPSCGGNGASYSR